MSLLPFLDGNAILLLDSIAVPFWDDIERTEWNDSKVWSKIMDVTPLESFKILVVLVLLVHHAKEE